jgi:LysM repeat protein
MGMRILIVLLFLCFSAVSLLAQEKLDIDGQEFVIHEVKKGETLYAISKKYSITVDDIKQANKDLIGDGLRIHQTLLIPIEKADRKTAKKSRVELSNDTIYHKVIKKQTLYGLSKLYDTDIESIKSYNPELREGLKVGMVVKIPAANTEAKTDSLSISMPEQDSLQYHKIKEGETLQSISDDYGLSPDSIQMLNNGFQQGLLEGIAIRIPIPNPEFVSFEDEVEIVDSSWIKKFDDIDTLFMSVLLPFYLKANVLTIETASASHSDLESVKLNPMSLVALDFMHGINLALDSLKEKFHTNIKIKYYDVFTDTQNVTPILEDSHLSRSHLIIGPLYPSLFEIFSKYALTHKIPIISPVKISGRNLLSNPYVFRAYASDASQNIRIAKYVQKEVHDSTTIIVSSGKYSDKRALDLIKKYTGRRDLPNDTLPVLTMPKPELKQLTNAIGDSKNVTLVVASNFEPFVSQVLSMAYDLSTNADSTHRIEVIGLESWQSFKSLSFDHLSALKVRYPSRYFVNYSDSLTISIAEKFIAKNGKEPNRYSFLAYDLTMYFGESMLTNGSKYAHHIKSNPKQCSASIYDFVQVGFESGFENTGSYVLKYHDYEVILSF